MWRYGCPRKLWLRQRRWVKEWKRRHFFIGAGRTQHGKPCSESYGARPAVRWKRFLSSWKVGNLRRRLCARTNHWICCARKCTRLGSWVAAQRTGWQKRRGMWWEKKKLQAEVAKGLEGSGLVGPCVVSVGVKNLFACVVRSFDKLDFLCLFRNEVFLSVRLRASKFLVYISEGRKEGVHHLFESELAAAGRSCFHFISSELVGSRTAIGDGCLFLLEPRASDLKPFKNENICENCCSCKGFGGGNDKIMANVTCSCLQGGHLT